MGVDIGINETEWRGRKSAHAFMVNWFNKGVNAIHWGKKSFLQEMLLGQPDIHIQKDEFGPLSHTITKITQNRW